MHAPRGPSIAEGAPRLVIAVDDPTSPDIRAILGAHLEFARLTTPVRNVHVLDVDDLLDPMVTLFSARRDGVVLGVGALREIDGSHVEIKSMHTIEEARGQGVGRAVLDHLLTVARERGYGRVSLETGAKEKFASARALYLGAGFEPCAPFGEYTAHERSICMTLKL